MKRLLGDYEVDASGRLSNQVIFFSKMPCPVVLFSILQPFCVLPQRGSISVYTSLVNHVLNFLPKQSVILHFMLPLAVQWISHVDTNNKRLLSLLFSFRSTACSASNQTDFCIGFTLLFPDPFKNRMPGYQNTCLIPFNINNRLLSLISSAQWQQFKIATKCHCIPPPQISLKTEAQKPASVGKAELLKQKHTQLKITLKERKR